MSHQLPKYSWLTPFGRAVGGGTAGGGGVAFPASTVNAALPSDMAFSAGRFTGFASDQVAGSPLATTVLGSGPLGDVVSGIDMGSTTVSNYFSVNGIFDGTVNVVMIYEQIAAFSGGVLFDLNGSNFLGAMQSGIGTAANGGGSVNMGVNGFLANGNAVAKTGTRGQLWTACEIGGTGVKWVAINTPSGVGSNLRPFQYPLDVVNFQADVHLKGFGTCTDWADVTQLAQALITRL